MKKSFTMIELVFVIVVIGILSTAIIPSTKTNSLQEAANQVLMHIRYTQHLAMVDDKYNLDDNRWFKQRWQMKFGTSQYTNQKIAYSIFSDSGSYDKKPNLSELAIDPNDQNRYLSGGYSGILMTDDTQNRASKIMNIGKSYGVDNILFAGGCRSNTYYLYFDYLGRPFNSMNKDKPYEKASSGWHKLLTSDCLISLCKGSCSGSSSDSEVIINIDKETGYAHILN